MSFQNLFIVFCFDTLKLTTYESLCADPYLNTDAGTMSPFEHGEVFVLDDGGEVWNLKFSVCFGYKLTFNFPCEYCFEF